MKDLMVYLKTAAHCNLNCDHCFTGGNTVESRFLDSVATIDFFKRLKKEKPHFNSANISFHGGEPMLCPIPIMREVWEGVKPLWINLWWSMQTNLVYKLTDDKLQFMQDVFTHGFGTSWDVNIRFATKKQEELWEENVRFLTKQMNMPLSVMVCVNEAVLDLEPIFIINKMADLGFKYINFERITPDGNALLNENIMPFNKKQDEWFLRMWQQSVEYKTYEYINNMFFDSILTSTVYTTFSGCRCRECEQKILTINPDGSVGGCPNGATWNTFGNISQDVNTLLYSPGRMCNIQEESTRPEPCWTCPVFNICNSDCHQLMWQNPDGVFVKHRAPRQGDICAAPKSFMLHIKDNPDMHLFKQFLQGFIGEE